MKICNLFIILILPISLSFHSFCKKQEIENLPLVAFLKDNKWHFLDHSGKELFKKKKLNVEIIDVLGYNEGFIRVNIKYNNKPYWAYIDLDGNVLVVSGVSYLFNFHNGRALAVKYFKGKGKDSVENEEYKFGFINYQGKVVIPLIYQDATEFSEGLAFVKNEQVRGYIDTTNRLVISLDTIAGNKFKEGLADVNTKNMIQGFIDTQGKLVIPLEYHLVNPFSEGLAFAIKGDTFGFLNKEGLFEFTVDGYIAKEFKEGLNFVGKFINQDSDLRWALINRNGEKITDYIYEDVKEFSEGFAVVKLNGKWFFIDGAGNKIFDKDFVFVDSFANGLAWISTKDGKCGYINKNGNLVIELPAADKYFDLRHNRRVY
ncbi:MAG: WG repeat-containing protein [Ignavibacteria bacterium]|nr:WG repeat-containing protein [Ignavibacteria bacterium]